MHRLIKISFVLTLLLLFNNVSYSQSISYSPVSFPAWGQVDGITEFSVEYYNTGIHLFVPYYTSETFAGKTTENFGLSYTPINIKDIFKIGGIATLKEFPRSNVTNLNFLLDLGYENENVRIAYRHISNGFGLFHEHNPGYDTLTFTIKL